MMPTRSFIVCCSSWWSVYGFSAAASAAPPSANGASASSAAASTSASVDRRPALAQPLDVRRRARAGPAAEDQQVGQRVAAEPVGAVHAAGDLAGREQARARAVAAVSASTSTPPIT